MFSVKKTHQRCVLFSILFVFALFAACGGESGAAHSEAACEQEKESQSQKPTAASDSEQSRFNKLKEEYNSSLELYNADVAKLNQFAAALEELGLTAPETYAEAEELTEDYEEYNIHDSDLSELENNVREITVFQENFSAHFDEMAVVAYNSIVEDYNILATEYANTIENCVIEYVADFPQTVDQMKAVTARSEISEVEEIAVICEQISQLQEETANLAGWLLIANQIINPEEQWVLERLKGIDTIIGVQAVSTKNDPNGLLGKEGGYTSCIYFAVSGVSEGKLSGDTIIATGTDGGGAIEIYETKEYALNRCDYLSQFDGTLLYSGSYTILGTMVIRTSYRLNDTEQIELTDQIIRVMTAYTEE